VQCSALRLVVLKGRSRKNPVRPGSDRMPTLSTLRAGRPVVPLGLPRPPLERPFIRPSGTFSPPGEGDGGCHYPAAGKRRLHDCLPPQRPDGRHRRSRGHWVMASPCRSVASFLWLLPSCSRRSHLSGGRRRRPDISCTRRQGRWDTGSSHSSSISSWRGGHLLPIEDTAPRGPSHRPTRLRDRSRTKTNGRLWSSVQQCAFCEGTRTRS